MKDEGRGMRKTKQRGGAGKSIQHQTQRIFLSLWSCLLNTWLRLKLSSRAQRSCVFACVHPGVFLSVCMLKKKRLRLKFCGVLKMCATRNKTHAQLLDSQQGGVSRRTETVWEERARRIEGRFSRKKDDKVIVDKRGREKKKTRRRGGEGTRGPGSQKRWNGDELRADEREAD